LKKIALISTFCNTQEKQDVLKNNILKLKELGVDVMVISPTSINQDIVDICDYFFFTKENPILKWPERANSFWWKNTNKYNKEIILHRDIDDYGWAALYQTKKLSEFALTYDYDIFYHVIYDVDISNELINDIINNIYNTTYHRINPKDSTDQWNVTLHFISFNKNNLSLFSEKIKKEDYLKINGFAEEFTEEILKNIPMTKSSFPIKDLIRYIDADDDDIFNYSQDKNYNIFFSNYLGEFSFVLYGIKEGNLKIVMNGEEITNIEELVPKRFLRENLDISSFIVIFNDKSIDYSNIINNIPRNVIND
jgi:hypothetical protein